MLLVILCMCGGGGCHRVLSGTSRVLLCICCNPASRSNRVGVKVKFLLFFVNFFLFFMLRLSLLKGKCFNMFLTILNYLRFAGLIKDMTKT